MGGITLSRSPPEISLMEMQITDFNRKVTEEACRHCHTDLADSMHSTLITREEISCLRCHHEVGHLE